MRLGYKMIKHYSGCVELIGNRLNAKVVLHSIHCVSDCYLFIDS